MKNYEKYEDEIKRFRKGGDFCDEFVILKIRKQDDCAGIGCERCHAIQLIWMLKEYEEPEEPEVDWSTVEVDTPILVRDYESKTWMTRHFAKYENGTVHAWFSGGTSWSCRDEENGTIPWKCAKLAEVDDGTS